MPEPANRPASSAPGRPAEPRSAAAQAHRPRAGPRGRRLPPTDRVRAEALSRPTSRHQLADGSQAYRNPAGRGAATSPTTTRPAVVVAATGRPDNQSGLTTGAPARAHILCERAGA